MREIRSSSAPRTSKSVPRPMSAGLPRMASLIGEKKPFAAGWIIDACRSFPTIIWSFFKGTILRQSMVCVSLMYADALAGGR